MVLCSRAVELRYLEARLGQGTHAPLTSTATHNVLVQPQSGATPRPGWAQERRSIWGARPFPRLRRPGLPGVRGIRSGQGAMCSHPRRRALSQAPDLRPTRRAHLVPVRREGLLSKGGVEDVVRRRRCEQGQCSSDRTAPTRSQTPPCSNRARGPHPPRVREVTCEPRAWAVQGIRER